RHPMNAAVRAGTAVLVIGLALTIACFALALGGSRHAPAWIDVFIPQTLILAGATLILLAAMRKSGQQQIRGALIWSVNNALTPEVSLDLRRSLEARAQLPFAAFVVMTLALVTDMQMTLEYPNAKKWGALRDRGVETTGRVVRKQVHGDQYRTYSIDYSFAAEGKDVHGYSEISRSLWSGVQEGDPLRVSYLPKNSYMSLPYPRSSLTLMAAVPYLAGDSWPVLLPILALALIGAYLHLKQRMMIGLGQNGSATIGEVTEIRGTSVRYAFNGPAGSVSGKFSFTAA